MQQRLKATYVQNVCFNLAETQRSQRKNVIFYPLRELCVFARNISECFETDSEKEDRGLFSTSLIFQDNKKHLS